MTALAYPKPRALWAEASVGRGSVRAGFSVKLVTGQTHPNEMQPLRGGLLSIALL
jgi:hypothetical protein